MAQPSVHDGLSKEKVKDTLFTPLLNCCPRLYTQILLNELILIINLSKSQIEEDSLFVMNNFLLFLSSKNQQVLNGYLVLKLNAPRFQGRQHDIIKM